MTDGLDSGVGYEPCKMCVCVFFWATRQWATSADACMRFLAIAREYSRTGFLLTAYTSIAQPVALVVTPSVVSPRALKGGGLVEAGLAGLVDGSAGSVDGTLPSGTSAVTTCTAARGRSTPTAVLRCPADWGMSLAGCSLLEPRVASGLPSGTQRVFRGLDAAAAGSAGQERRRLAQRCAEHGPVGGGLFRL